MSVIRMREWNARRILSVAATLGVLLCLAALTASAQAASGTWDRAWGKNVDSTGGPGVEEICIIAANCQPGSTPITAQGGEFNGPAGVATDSSGNVYVADIGYSRIQKFDSSGNFLRAWGKNVNGGGVFGICTVAANCLAGASGGLGGELNSPEGVATDTSGHVYVADTGNQRIQEFDSSGNFLRAWGKNVNGGGVFGICTAPASCLMGTTGGLGGAFNNPRGVGTDGSGGVYVADTSNHRIQKFDAAGNFQRTWGKGVSGGTGAELCTSANSCQAGTPGTFGGELFGPYSVAADTAGNVYVAELNIHRISKFDPASNFQRAWGKNVNGGGVFGVCTMAASCLAGTTGPLGGDLNGPAGIATDGAGNVYVADSFNHRIQRFDASGNFQRAWGKNVNGGGVFGVCTVAASCLAGTTGGLGGELNGPQGVATDSTGNLYVGDRTNQRIQKFADPVLPAPVSPPSSATGQRAAALKKCKKKKPGKVRTKCKKKANKLPV